MSLGKICFAFSALIFVLLCFKIVEPTGKIDIVSGAFALLALGLLFEGIVFKVPAVVTRE